MAITDYDAPRNTTEQVQPESLELLKERRVANVGDDLDPEASDEFELPGFDILDEDLTAPVIPIRSDEFRCSSCFLVLHRTLHASTRTTGEVCRDCA